MFPFFGLLPKAGVFVANVVEEHTGTGVVRQEITFFRDGTFGEAGYSGGDACSGVSTLYPGQWWHNSPEADIGDDYEVRAVSIESGIFNVGASPLGTWIVMDADNGHCWGLLRSEAEGPGTENVQATFEIRDIATETIRQTFTIDLTVTKE